ncbi:FecR family protein [Cyclobacterium lianum]|uniref:FecR family protein n=1 Tax=Cyclobacterium lianum TaxID=388280 RepID=A0A1M7QNR6_9BACT|nr:FecR domain-containing protein [Cyclobacterium lianum]SHN33123.1 FecR family protein [Cyclobacterium lianum]
MDIYNDTVKSLVLNPEFRKWVLYPDPELNKTWKQYLSANPASVTDVELARELILELFSNQYPLQNKEYKEIWDKIETETTKEDQQKQFGKVVPIRQGMVQAQITSTKAAFQLGYFWRIASILLVALGLGFLASRYMLPEPTAEIPQPVKNVVFNNPPGVKSSISLADGTRVMLNAGSSLSYEENRFKAVRDVFLEGEAYFEVAHDPDRPFTVHAGGVNTTALGTSFNIMAYKGEKQMISLVTGKVSIAFPDLKNEEILLAPKEAISISTDKRLISRTEFDEDAILAWTRKTILFDDTKLAEAIRALENWYGVRIHFQNQPKPGMHLSGKFHNETLENVLEGLSYTAGIDFLIGKDQVSIKFNK